jgi:hypothetical protein
MRIVLCLTLLALISGRCDDAAKSSCISSVIDSIKKEPVRNPPASVWSFEHEGKTFFYIPPYCCDNFGVIYDTQCNVLCHPDGGFSGRGDGKCEGIDLSNKVLIWKDDRGS